MNGEEKQGSGRICPILTAGRDDGMASLCQGEICDWHTGDCCVVTRIKNELHYLSLEVERVKDYLQEIKLKQASK